jgi:hypothetical protein
MSMTYTWHSGHICVCICILDFRDSQVEGEACRDRGRRQGECGSKLGSFYGGKTRGLLRLGEGYFRGSGLRRLGRFCGVCRGCLECSCGFFVGCCLGLLLLVLWVLLVSLGLLLGAFRRS